MSTNVSGNRPSDDAVPTGPITDEERSAARRELVRMPADLREKVHRSAHSRGVDTVDGMAWFIREERVRRGQVPR